MGERMRKRTYKVTRKFVPAWATSAEAVKARLLESYTDRVRICCMAWCSGWSATEIGAALGLTPSHVRVILSRARRECATNR
jgi:DNA-directed RNA polymerase specialized sigma24 family protein